MIKRIYLLAFLFTLLTSHSYSQNLDEIKKYETCADELLVNNFKTKADDYFFAHFETKIDDYLSLSIKNKIDNNKYMNGFMRIARSKLKQNPYHLI